MLPLTGGIALGMLPDLQYRQNTITLAPGDSVVFYTDGVTEAMDGADQEFGTERLYKIFTAAPPKSSREANQAVFEAVRSFVGDTPQSDDITCLTLCRSARVQ